MNLGERIREAGLSRAAYYSRINRGMSAEEALTVPKGHRASGPTMLDALKKARALGLMGDTRPPTQLVYGKLRAAGVPSLLAVMVGRQPAEVSAEQERRAAAAMEDPNATVRLVQSVPFVSTLRALYGNMEALTGEQVKAVLLNLLENAADGSASANQANEDRQEHEPSPDQ